MPTLDLPQARRPTEADIRAARRQLRDTARVERIGLQAATMIGARMQRAANQALRQGRDIVAAVDAQLQEAIAVLTEAQVVAHLQGKRRAVLNEAQAIPRPPSLRLSVFDKTLSFLQRRMDVTDEQLAALRMQYGQESLRVIGQASGEVEKKILTAVQESVASGDGVREASKRLREAFDRAGVTPAKPHTLEAVFRTQTQMAYGAGRWHELMQSDLLWGFRYSTAGDDRVRPEHAALEGTTLPKDHPFWQATWPPNGWNCRCTVIELFEPHDIVQPMEPFEIDGMRIVPGADPGFGFNPGEVFPDQPRTPVLTPQPGGISELGRSLTFSGRGRVVEAAREAVEAAATVHTTARLPRIPVVQSSGRQTMGAYRYYPDSGRPVEIRVSRNSPHPQMTTLHEVGHFLDHQVLGVPGQFASASHARLEGFRQAVRQTEAYRQLERLGRHPSGAIRAHAAYLLDDREAFARAYAQFIATRSGQRTMMDELRVARSSSIPRQWADDDFRPVAKAIEELLRGMGWLK